MVRYSEDILDEIRNQLDIIEIVSEYVPLKPSGKGHKGLCPFHQEKTPSFMVDPDRQIFHCFGCGEGGNIFSFIMKIEKVNFPEAVRILAGKANIQLPADQYQDDDLYREKELLLHLNEIAADYYQKNLFSIQGKSALQYLIKRHFTKEMIQKFKLGYALPGFEHLIHVLLSKKIQLPVLLKAGLVVKGQKSGKMIDYFRNRIIFPIISLQGKTVAFGGRVLDDALPKYINSPETSVYNKGKHLYGMFQARRSIRQLNQVIIVEGYTDVIIAHQFGFENTVAPLGTALTSKQVDLIKRYADEVVIAFDSDTAGKSATLRSLDLIKKTSIKVRILSLSKGKDPADIIPEKGKDYFTKLIQNALPLIDYKLNVLMQNYDKTTSEGKVAIIRELFQDLSHISSEVELIEEVKKIAEKLELEEGNILKDLNRYQRGNRSLSNISSKRVTESTFENAEKILIGSMLQNKDDSEKIFSELEVEDFTVNEHRYIVSVIKNLFKRGEIISLQKVIDEISNPKITNLISEIMLKDIISSDPETVHRSIKAIKKNQLQLELKKIKSKIKEEENEKKEVAPELLKNYQDILYKIKTIV